MPTMLSRAADGTADVMMAVGSRVIAMGDRLRGHRQPTENETRLADFTVRTWVDKLDGGWIASVDELPGCFSMGPTEEEALVNVADAIAGVVETHLSRALKAEAPSPAPARESSEEPGHLRHVTVAAC